MFLFKQLLFKAFFSTIKNKKVEGLN